MDDVDAIVSLVAFLVFVLIFAFIGRLIGQKRGQSDGGAALGALLGPVGLVGAAFLPDKRRQCPACKGRVPDDARKCMHCGESLQSPQPEPPSEMRIACPLCAAPLLVSTLIRGENQCPHCAEKFVAE